MHARPAPARNAFSDNISAGGFTLIELLVAISVMAVMAVMSWRGLDGMTQAQISLQKRADEVLTLQAGLNQWGADLDALMQLPQTQSLDWDGRALRMTRRSATTLVDASSQRISDEAVLVVAWARRDVAGVGQWLRWQSPPLRTRGEIDVAWQGAAQWAQNPGDDLKSREVLISPLSEWQVFFYRGDAWTNPLSSVGVGASGATAVGSSIGPVAGIPPGAAAIGMGALGAAIVQAISQGANALTAAPIPEGVRLVLTLPPGNAISGPLTRDWVRPTLGGGR